MITCPKCSKDNQVHYKFCLGCGAELPRETTPSKMAPPQTPTHSLRAAANAAGHGGTSPLAQSPPAVPGPPVPTFARSPAQVPPFAHPPAPSQGSGYPAVGFAPPQAAVPGFSAAPMAPTPSPAAVSIACPQCGHTNAPTNIFCGSCGFRVTPGSARAAPVAPVPGPAPSTVVLTALRADGTEAGTYALPGGTVTVGRETGAIFAGDSYLSPRHATFKTQSGQVTVRDEGSLNGVYKKLQRDSPVELRPGDMFRIGQEIIKYESLAAQASSPDGVERLGSPAKGYVGRIALIVGRDVTGNAFPIPETGIHLGRERGDVLFPEDGYVSGLHCRIAPETGRVLLTDLGSSNGSFVRLRDEAEVRDGDVLLMGQQLFRVST